MCIRDSRYVAPPGLAIDSTKRHVKTIGRYELIEVLGKGAMGVVYRARDPMLDRTVAVKTISSPKGQGKRVRKAYLERFEREAKAAAKMQHPAIVTIFDVGQDDGLPFMVLEYLPGESLADRLDRVRIPLGKVVQIGLDLASALGFAHKERIVHRDVKPANVLHAGESRWKLADFGIARMPDSDLTQVGIFMGTPGYAPPEAISQGRYTSKADVFAWGAVLYELLSGRIPYEGPDTRTTNGLVLKNTAKSPRAFDPSIPEPLAEVVMRALHPSTDKRYQDGAEAERGLREAWERSLHSNLVSAQSLTGQEVPHEKAAKQFHGLPAAGIHTSPPHEGGGVEDSGVMIAPRQDGTEGDDDPTALYHGDSGPVSSPRVVASPFHGYAPSSTSSKDTVEDVRAASQSRHHDVVEAKARAAERSTQSNVGFDGVLARQGQKKTSPIFWLFLLALVFGAGVAVTYFLLSP